MTEFDAAAATACGSLTEEERAALRTLTAVGGWLPGTALRLAGALCDDQGTYTAFGRAVRRVLHPEVNLRPPQKRGLTFETAAALFRIGKLKAFQVEAAAVDFLENGGDNDTACELAFGEPQWHDDDTLEKFGRVLRETGRTPTEEEARRTAARHVLLGIATGDVAPEAGLHELRYTVMPSTLTDEEDQWLRKLSLAGVRDNYYAYDTSAYRDEFAGPYLAALDAAVVAEARRWLVVDAMRTESRSRHPRPPKP